MKRQASFFLTAILALLFVSNASAQLFEGMITMEISSVKMEKPMMMMISTKGNKTMSEMQMAQGNMRMYMDMASGKMTMVMEAMKMGMEMDMNKVKEMAKNSSRDSTVPKVEDTEQKKVINGHSCELYRVTTATGAQSNWWMTDDLPKSLLNSLKTIYHNSGGAMGSKNTGPGEAAIEAMFKKGLVPIQVESIKDGKTETTVTFVKYEQKHLDDSVFTIPSDIKIQQMPAGMGGMGGQ